MKKTKIDWCDTTVNPVVGCPNGCEYCYGRRMNTRFGWIKDWDSPQFFPERLKEFESKTSKSIFIDSMSDIGTWHYDWLGEVIKAMRKNPQHWYLVLTKTNINELIDKLWTLCEKHREILPLYVGKSVTTQVQANSLVANHETTDFLSIEPILEPIDMTRAIITTRTIILGAETGNRKGKVIPQKEWIDDIVQQADVCDIKVFMKESLRVIMGESFRQDELPWEVER